MTFHASIIYHLKAMKKAFLFSFIYPFSPHAFLKYNIKDLKKLELDKYSLENYKVLCP